MINAVNEQFSRFVSFAENRMAAGKDKAIARKGDVEKGGGTTLEERNITLSNRIDWVSLSFFRGKGAQNDNNAVRELFRKSVADMFGGEKNIPQSVRDAMLMKDYGCGKPLTARRIIAVRDAIANLERGNVFDSGNDPDGALANKAIAAGYTRLDFGKLNTAANLFAKAAHMPLQTAFEQVIAKGSAANRTMNAGSLYMKDAASFLVGYVGIRQIAEGDEQNKTLARDFASREGTVQLGKIAENLAYKFRNIFNDAEKLRVAAGLPAGILDELREAANNVAGSMETVGNELASGTLTDRKQICRRLFQNQNVNLTNVAKDSVVVPLKDAAKGNAAIAEFRDYVADLLDKANDEYNDLFNTYKKALSHDLADEARANLTGAAHQAGINTGRQVTIPAAIMDNLEGIIESAPFDRLENINRLCERLEAHGDAALRFSDGQKDILKALVEQTFGKGPRAEKMLQRLVDQFETSFFAEQLNDPFDFSKVNPSRPEMVVRHLQAHPEALRALETGFRLDTAEDVAAVKDTLRRKLVATRDECLKIDDVQQARCLSTGLMIQSLREYKKGFVTLDGRDIPNAQLGTNYPLLIKANEDDLAAQKGYAEFLEKTFDGEHKKMRQTVSFVCGMADGLYGVIDSLVNFGGEGGEHLKSLPRTKLGEGGTVISDAGRLPEDKYNLEIAENGDVKITLTHIVRNKVTNLIGEDVFFAPPSFAGAYNGIVLGGAKMTVTMTIRNASDAELGNGMPEMTVDDIRQEEL